MKIYSAEFFETKIRYEKMTDDGMMKKVTETYLVDAVSFGEAEKRTMDEMSSYISGEAGIIAVKMVNFKEVLATEDDTANLWYKVRIEVSMIDEKTAKVKKCSMNYLVQGKSVDDAKNTLSKYLDNSMLDWNLSSISETNIMDVFFYCKANEEISEE